MRRSQWRRILAAVLIALIGFSGTSVLGFWQYSRAHRDDIEQQVLQAAPVPVQQLVTPGAYVPEVGFAHAVRLQGDLLGSRALGTCGRTQDGLAGCWVLAPVQVGAHGSTAVLGFVEDALLPSALRTVRAGGDVSVEVLGRLQPAEVIDRGNAILRPAETVPVINVNELAMRWQTPLRDGYVVLEQALVGSAVTAPLITPPSGITWRNLIYAWQWWAFAAFVLFLLVRYISDVRQESPASTSPDEEEQP